MTKRHGKRQDDDRELGIIWAGLNRFGDAAAKTIHRLSIAADRLIRRLETPPPGVTPQVVQITPRVEPRFAAMSTPPRSEPRNGEVTAALIAVDGLTIEATAAALKALAQVAPEHGNSHQRAAIGSLTNHLAGATEGYMAVAADALDLNGSNPSSEPVWAGSLERRFMAVIAAAEAFMMALGKESAGKQGRKSRPGSQGPRV